MTDGSLAETPVKDGAQHHKKDIPNFVIDAHGLGKQAQWFRQIQIGPPQCEARGHKIDIPDFVMEAHGQGTQAQWF